MAEAALVWLALELLIYQARYQWNDIRGHAADLEHPQAASRGRLPGPATRARAHVRASWAVVALRLALVGALAALVPALAATLGVLTVAVFGVAVVYELVRARAIGKGDEVPPPLRGAIVAIWLIVGCGYAIRAVAGLGLAVDLADNPLLAVAAIVMAWSFGVAFVTTRWVLEALPFADIAADRLAWRSDSARSREHTLALARWLPELSRLAASRLSSPAAWMPLREKTRLRAPWNAATSVAGGAAGVTGLALVSEDGVGGLVLAGAIGAGCAAAVAIAAARARLPLAAAGAIAVAAAQALAGSPRPVASVLPWLLVVSSHILFCAQSAETLGHPLRGLFVRGRVRRGASGRRARGAVSA